MSSKKPTTTTATRPEHGSGLRFAFYGRTSTTRHQDRVSSQGWQRDMANDLITSHGQIITEYFDELPPVRRTRQVWGQVAACGG
jgi:hypothetical protein